MKRVFLIVLDSVGIGEMPDAGMYGDEGSNTVASIVKSKDFYAPNLEKLGLFQIDGLKDILSCKTAEFDGVIGRMTERSKGKDTTIGHWEIAGVISEKPLPTFPDGFPYELINRFEELTGRKTLCNKPYSGTEVIKDFGREHMETGALIVYTSADSVFQIAAHEDIVPIDELYHYCEIARDLCTGDFALGRVIARPFEGEYPFKRTIRRHDYSLVPPERTMLNYLKGNSFDVLAVGKINDIFAGDGITEAVRTMNNEEGIEKILLYMNKEFNGLCFANLVDFDMIYGHRNDIDGYAKAISHFDKCIPELIGGISEDDIIIITADHGCDPGTISTDHSREYTPLIMYGKSLKKGYNLGTRSSFADIGKSILSYFGVSNNTAGISFIEECIK